MPASITIALVASSPKVIGSRIEMPASGPMPGSTPTSVPTRQPRNAYHSTAGCSATEKPSQRLSSAPIANRPNQLPSEPGPQRAGLERRLQRGAEHPPGDHREADAVGGGAKHILALDHHQQREHEQRHRRDEAERGVDRDPDRA